MIDLSKIKIACLKCLPQVKLTALFGKLSHNKKPWLKNRLIRLFVWAYGVNLSEAMEENSQKYECFHDFFIRSLKKSARPISLEPSHISSPADGRVSQYGTVHDQALIQAKDKLFSLHALLGYDNDATTAFEKASYLTIYLAPADYHRIHMPFAGKLMSMRYIPGFLFPVNAFAVNHVDQLFARNERVICLFETAIGQMAIIFVGAMLVGSISTVWHQTVNPSRMSGPHMAYWDYQDQHLSYQVGQDIGHFSFGSTVIVLFESPQIAWSIKLLNKVKMGETIGSIA